MEQLKSNSSLNSPRLVRLRTAVIISIIISLIMSLIISSSLLIMYALVQNFAKPKNIQQQREIISQEGDVIADIAKNVGPSVVSIMTTQRVTTNDFFFGQNTQMAQAAGTGIIINEDGLIMTNKHVVPEGTSAVQIVTSDGATYDDAKVIGRDSMNDIAFIKVANPKSFKPARLGDSDSVKIGQRVVAIGNALGEFQNSVTSGILSGKGRPVAASGEGMTRAEQLTNLFQTDAAINSGNSGGPLLNLNGEVIGINTAIAQGAENIGFAIPINDAKGLITSVESTGKIERPYLGVRFVMLTPALTKQLKTSAENGAWISTDADSIIAGSPADKAGLRPGDVILSINDIKLDNNTQLTSAVARFKVGDKVNVEILRGDETKTIDLTLEPAPSN